MSLATRRLLLLGCGAMGRALLNGWIERGVQAANVAVVDPGLACDALPSGVRLISGEAAARETVDACVIAVKPQVVADVLPLYAPLAGRGTLFLSIAAGKTLEGLGALLGGSARLVRVMPNTPAAIGRGISALIAGDGVDQDARSLAQTLMQAAGKTVWLDDEAKMDAVTALSGSGPAYVFALTEAMAKAGVALGLPMDLAALLARETVCGSGALMAASSDAPDQLRRNVTSPNGTTAAGLSALMDPASGLEPLLERTLLAAAGRSRELSS